jgi:class 3 adenylate cyclase
VTSTGRNVVRGFDAPDERRSFPGGFLDLVAVGPLTFGRDTLQPGWRWSTDVKPIVGTERCEHHHVGYQLSGRWICEDREGVQVEIGPGDVFDTPPGHDSWVVGDEPSVSIEFQGIADWAAKGTSERTVTTVVFADVVDSTALIGLIGDTAWRRLQSQYLENVLSLLEEHGGVLVSTAGDGVLGTFARPGSAVRCASALVGAAHRLGLQVRAGAHTGEVEAKGDGISGMTVHIGARVQALAGPGEVLVTSTTHDLTVDSGISYVPRGSFELKGVPQPRTLYAVEPEGVR